jgi:hypothetical protein
MLVVSTTAIYVAWFFMPYWTGYLSDFEYKLTQYNGFRAILPVQTPLYYNVWLGLWLIAAFGLVFFQNWARHLFLALTFLGTALAPFNGFSVQPPIDVLFSTTNLLLDGAILAMAYLSPLSACFNQERPTTRSSRRRR